MTSAHTHTDVDSVFQLNCVGFRLKHNALCCRLTAAATRSVLVFGGDIQTHAAHMLRSPYAELAECYSLESTCQLVFRRFGGSANVFVWVPAVFTVDHRSLFNLAIGSHCFHVAAVLEAACTLLAHESRIGAVAADHVRSILQTAPLALVGFSAGCVVLNSLITELCTRSTDVAFLDWESDAAAAALPPIELSSLLKRVDPTIPAWFRDQHGFDVVQRFFHNVDFIHFCDAHRFPTSPRALERLCEYAKNRDAEQRPFTISLHATPRQVRDLRRAFIKREFETFAAAKCCTSRIYFEHEKSSLAQHFRVLDEFDIERRVDDESNTDDEQEEQEEATSDSNDATTKEDENDDIAIVVKSS
jgi:hypothetical protein